MIGHRILSGNAAPLRPTGQTLLDTGPCATGTEARATGTEARATGTEPVCHWYRARVPLVLRRVPLGIAGSSDGVSEGGGYVIWFGAVME